ncbi:hypothetical protein HAX54_019274 [Datura stramonium]|uniref:Uncharacterized protein n=1 Tax=Datura stramonium TaxID=4076 RepID=A0ABS8S259_DATST|nr:hypothetical protein [Datura stramonium]
MALMRLFVGEPVWTPYNRPQEDHPARVLLKEIQTFVKELLFTRSYICSCDGYTDDGEKDGRGCIAAYLSFMDQSFCSLQRDDCKSGNKIELQSTSLNTTRHDAKAKQIKTMSRLPLPEK